MFSVIVLATTVALAACGGDDDDDAGSPATSGPAGETAPPATSGGTGDTATPGTGDADWNAVIEAAKEEGTLVLGTGAGPGFELFAEAVKEAMAPYFDVETTLMRGGDWVSRVLAEQGAGQYLWDVHVGPGNNKYTALAPAGGLDNTREFMESLPPDNREDADWRGGFSFYDDAEGGSFVHQVGLSNTVGINRDVEGAEEIQSPEDLLDPKWSGQIAMYEPTSVNAAVQGLTWFLGQPEYGEEYVRALFGQDIVFGDRPQITQWLAEGRYAAAFGIDDTTLVELQEQGIGENVEVMDYGTYLGVETTSVIKNPPHPNATKVFLDWFISTEGQTAWVELSTEDSSSRRLDAPDLHPDLTPQFETLEELGPVGGASQDAEVVIQQILAIAEEEYR
jgi:ABC-type Fe3+ transport system substrate-binding protein